MQRRSISIHAFARDGRTRELLWRENARRREASFRPSARVDYFFLSPARVSALSFVLRTPLLLLFPSLSAPASHASSAAYAAACCAVCVRGGVRACAAPAAAPSPAAALGLRRRLLASGVERRVSPQRRRRAVWPAHLQPCVSARAAILAWLFLRDVWPVCLLRRRSSWRRLAATCRSSEGASPSYARAPRRARSRGPRMASV